MERILNSSEAAKVIGVSKKTLLRYRHTRLVSYMVYPDGSYRFRQSALERWMARRTVAVAA